MSTQSRLSWFVVFESIFALSMLLALTVSRWPILSTATSVCALLLAALIPLAVWRARTARQPLPLWLRHTWRAMTAAIVLSILAFATGYDHLFTLV